MGDASRLDRIFGNLLENAMRYTPKGSTSRSAWKIRAIPCSPSWTTKAPGLPPDQRVDQLFALFAKGKSNAGKAGLGLYFCKITVERWGGTIGAETHEPRRLALLVSPASRARRPQNRQNRTPPEKSTGKRKITKNEAKPNILCAS